MGENQSVKLKKTFLNQKVYSLSYDLLHSLN